MIFHINPVGAPRMTRRDKWAKRLCVVRYFAYRNELVKQARGWIPGVVLDVTFYLPMPKSWSNKKKSKFAGKPHQNKPDIDNLVKGFLDAFGEDKQVWSICAKKTWDYEGRIDTKHA